MRREASTAYVNSGDLKISTTSTDISHPPKKIVQLSLGSKRKHTPCVDTPHIKLFPT